VIHLAKDKRGIAMKFAGVSRRDFSAGVSAIVAGAGAATTARADAPPDSAGGGITRAHAASHQEVVFAAEATRVYQMLTVAALFDRVVRLSGAMNSMMKSKLGAEPTRIDARPGGAFALFGGYITGYNLELIPETRLVQAWHSGSWPAGAFSIARFSLSGNGAHTTIVFDHTGFPDGEAEHLAKGWHLNYWEPIAKALAERP